MNNKIHIYYIDYIGISPNAVNINDSMHTQTSVILIVTLLAGYQLFVVNDTVFPLRVAV